jgi:hypothetical protein
MPPLDKRIPQPNDKKFQEENCIATQIYNFVIITVSTTQQLSIPELPSTAEERLPTDVV